MKEIRPRLTEEEYAFILEKRKLEQEYNQKITQAVELKPRTPPPNLPKIPKILLLDIETLPMEVRVWGLYKQRISHESVIKDYCIVSWAAKWLYDSEIIGDVLTPEEAINRDDGRIMGTMWKMLNDADVVVAHNGKMFDIRKLNARFWINKMKPPAPYKLIDTLIEYQKVMGLSSFKMDFISKLINRRGKIETNYQLWIDCSEGEQESLDYMFEYNKNDVAILEEAYLEIRPWMTTHPNLAIIGEATDKCCVYCGSTAISESGFYYTPAGRFATYRCESCDGISRSRRTDIPPSLRGKLLGPLSPP